MGHQDVETVLRCYPQIYFACHRRHVRDEKTGEPTGILLNRAQELVEKHLPPMTME